MSYALAVLILLLATGLRLWDLTTVPVGLHAEEVLSLRLSDTVRSGDIRVFYPLGESDARENLYYTALAFTRLGTGTGSIGYRIISVFANIIMLALVYTTGVRLFGYLAGLASMALLAVMMWASLLARLAVPQAFLPLMVIAVMLALARALPVYRQYRSEVTSVTAFAAVGAAIGTAFYVHPASLLIALGAMAFITYTVFTQRPLSTQRLSYIGFAILLIFILATPYFLSSINLPELSGGSRLFYTDTSFFRSIAPTLSGILFVGDRNPAFNLPGRPLIDLVSGLIALLGLVTCIRYWRYPRYALVLIMLIFLAPAAIWAPNAPNFPAMSVLLPPLALCFGLGISLIVNSLQSRLGIFAIVAVVVGMAFNVIWTVNDLFIRWPQLSDVEAAYESDIGHLARFIDQTAGETPTVVCHRRYNDFTPHEELNNTQLTLLMMNRPTEQVRFVDCRQSLVFANGGGHEHIIVAGPDELEGVHPRIEEWLSLGAPLSAENDPSIDERVIADLPEGAVLAMEDITEVVASEMGKFTTIAPANYNVPDAEGQPVAPPIRFGGNVTWLGYEAQGIPVYRPGDIVTTINYWRIEGLTPPDLVFFNHVLSDPVTIVAQRDQLSVDASRLRERDILAQVTYIRLPRALSPGSYGLSTGAYQWTSRLRLDVLDDDQPRGNSLILYGIEVVPRR